jgi:hypothetical protein
LLPPPGVEAEEELEVEDGEAVVVEVGSLLPSPSKPETGGEEESRVS